jgi:hypothetical protein
VWEEWRLERNGGKSVSIYNLPLTCSFVLPAPFTSKVFGEKSAKALNRLAASLQLPDISRGLPIVTFTRDVWKYVESWDKYTANSDTVSTKVSSSCTTTAAQSS